MAPANHLENQLSKNLLEKLTGTPSYDYGIGRCFGSRGRSQYGAGEGHGVAWKIKSGANLSNLKCPVHEGGPLYQTTRVWRCHEWTVIPAETVNAVAKAAYEAKKAHLSKKEQAGSLTKLRDLEPGQLFDVKGRSRKVWGGKVVEVEKIAGGKVRVTVSRSYQEVAGHRAWYLPAFDAEGYVEAVESLTRTFEAPGSTLVVTGEELAGTWQGRVWTSGKYTEGFGSSRVEKDWPGWAVDQPQCVVEHWTTRVRQLREQLERGQFAVVPTRQYHETDERYEERRQEARDRARVQRARVEAELAQAEERLQLHTGSVNA